MYDAFAEERLQRLPALERTDWHECRRRLSRLYFSLVQLRLNSLELSESKSVIEDTCDYLRRLANTIEQYLFSISSAGSDEEQNYSRSYAFIAAEAIDLWSSYAKTIRPGEPADVDMTYARIESALLYLASDYQVNAHCSVNDLNEQLFLHLYDEEQRDHHIVYYLQGAICALASGNLQNVPEVPVIDYQQYSTVIAARIAIMVRMGSLIVSYCEWLTGMVEDNHVEQNLMALHELIEPDSDSHIIGQFADLLHLCALLIHVVRSSKPFSLMNVLPRPQITRDARRNYECYLSNRAARRPFLWPSTREYINSAFPGPHSDAVVVVPTGSGKSFLAELACSQAMHNGWVLYLAPTNALVHQVQRDLKEAFKPFAGAQILSFIGGQEYTSLAGEHLDMPREMSVAVMTPEKCAMALRINPDAFLNCRLCVVDEYHTINDKQRGITLDLCLAQILKANSEVRLLLMSAMVSNGDDVTGWLQKLREVQNVPLVQVPWRPCRTLRSLLIVDRERAIAAFNRAKSVLEGLPTARKNVRFVAPLGLLGGMCMQWEEGGNIDDYVSIPVQLGFDGKATRSTSNVVRHLADWSGWKNTVSRQLSEKFSLCDSSVLCFILTSRHHVFSCAEKTNLDRNPTLDRHSEALLGLANAELGISSKVGELLRRGVGVHSSAMLDTEQAAVERSFGNRSIGLLFATPTLAQGLNLPADVVIVAGSSLGDPRQADNIRGVLSADATILNAFGRAGRAMVANHGLAVLVSDNPFLGPLREGVGVDAAITRYRLLSESDRCLRVSSPIESFVTRLTPDVPLDQFSVEELDLVAQLGGDGTGSDDVLSSTFGAYLAQERRADLSIEAAVGRVQNIKIRLSEEYGMPVWMPTAAMKGGIDLLTCWHLWRGMNSDGHLIIESDSLTSMQSCLNTFIVIMASLPPRDVRKILPDTVRQMDTVLDRMLARFGNDHYAVDWEVPSDWGELWSELSRLVWMYMNGNTYAEMASLFLAIAPEKINSERSQGQAPIPAIFSLVGRVMHHLSIYAGAVLVILEESSLLNGHLGEMPLLPLCIRNGCCDRNSLAWFRYGYRNRVAAHEFSRQFPIPADIQDESRVMAWVTQQRRDWLREDSTEHESMVLQYVRSVIAS